MSIAVARRSAVFRRVTVHGGETLRRRSRCVALNSREAAALRRRRVDAEENMLEFNRAYRFGSGKCLQAGGGIRRSWAGAQEDQPLLSTRRTILRCRPTSSRSTALREVGSGVGGGVSVLT